MSNSLTNYGEITVYDYQVISGTATWTKVGNSIWGEANAKALGAFQMSISSDGSRLAVGNPDAFNYKGQTRVYELDGNTWSQIGSDINGSVTSENVGYSTNLSADGTRLVTSARGLPSSGITPGAVKVFNWDGSDWVEQAIIYGENNADQFGHSISLTPDGSRLAVSAPLNDRANTNVGHVRIFDLSLK